MNVVHAAIDQYLIRTSTEGRSRVAAAMRRLEVRIGKLIGLPAVGAHSSAAEGQNLTRARAVRVPADGHNEDVVEQVIADPWDDYCTREFGTSRLKLPREERQDVVASLRESGLSIRAIAAAIGLAKDTVERDLNAGVPNQDTSPPGAYDLTPVELDEEGDLVTTGVNRETVMKDLAQVDGNQPPAEPGGSYDLTSVVASLRDSGLSIPAIAAATGLGVGTVHRTLTDSSGFPTGKPELVPVELDSETGDLPSKPEDDRRIVGTDGKSYAEGAAGA